MSQKQKIQQQKNKSAPSGVLLYAKKSGMTSFSSLWSIKHALGTDKVGHTGTLDSFADGLLVVLSGNLTHLVPHITGYKKSYEAIVCFGKTTDTLDPTGEITETGKVVSRKEIEDTLPSFRGALLQVPPVYSAVHVDGKRASDMARNGQEVNIESRQIFVYENEICDYLEDPENQCVYAHLKITCSKGTYIRALARDIAKQMGTCGYLIGLRRTSVGPFKLSDAACYRDLKDFSIKNVLSDFSASLKSKAADSKTDDDKEKSDDSSVKKQKLQKAKDSPETVSDIQNHFMHFTPELAEECGFNVDYLNGDNEENYLHGRPLNSSMFTRVKKSIDNGYTFDDEIAVFYEDKSFAGMIRKQDSKLVYGFVVQPQKPNINEKLRVFSWEQIERGDFPFEWKKQGTALSVGSFDGMHLGHEALVDAVLEQKNLVKGIVTFRNSARKVYEGVDEKEVFTLQQKLDFFADKGLTFAIVIDFSEEFSKIEGSVFIETLVKNCSLRFIAEGFDFRCGYKGALDVKGLFELSRKYGFAVQEVRDVDFDGKRISSTRIRNAVAACDFIDAQKMLGRPFTFDCRGLGWTKASESSESKSCIFVSTKQSMQVLPRDGNYDVVALLSTSEDAECDTYRTTMAVESDTETEAGINQAGSRKTVKICLSDQKMADKLTGIRFLS